MVTDVFNRMVSYVSSSYNTFLYMSSLTWLVLSSSCASKCLNQRYAEGELTKGESVCIDRCVGKFLEANKVIGEKLRESGGLNQGV
jgi:hypothetical protein